MEEILKANGWKKDEVSFVLEMIDVKDSPKKVPKYPSADSVKG